MYAIFRARFLVTVPHRTFHFVYTDIVDKNLYLLVTLLRNIDLHLR